MRYVIAHPPSTTYAVDYTASFLIVCEGFGDASFASAILEHYGITNYQVGCPTQRTVGGEGKGSISKYLLAIAGHPNAKNLRGIIVMIDADENPEASFRHAVDALREAEFLAPPSPYISSEGNGPRTAIVLIPDSKTPGTLEHLLLDAASEKEPVLKDCVDDFATCTEHANTWTANKQVKMKLTSIIAARCEELPSCSLAWIWNKEGNPIPINSARFNHLAEFFRQFSS
jgi:hypothetical protein